MEWIIFICSVIAIIIFAIAILRSRSNRRGIQDGDDSLERLGGGLKKAEDTNKEFGREIDKAKGITELIDGHNLSATNGIRTAKDILENAERRKSDS